MALRYTVKLTRPGVDPRNPAFADEANLTPAQLYTLPEDAMRKTLSFNARFGGRLPNSIGHVLPPGSGFIQLGNVGGDFYLFANNPNFDQNPGARCFIDVTDTDTGTTYKLWRGWTTGLTMTDTPDAQKSVLLELQGALGQFRGVYSEAFLQLGLSDILCGVAMRRLITDAEWPYPVSIANGNTLINFVGLNQRNLFFGGDRQGVNALAAFEFIAQAEPGRIYDDNLGRIVFEDRYRRSTGIVGGTVWPINNPISARQLPIHESIINEVVTQGQKLLRAGSGSVKTYLDTMGRFNPNGYASFMPFTGEVTAAEPNGTPGTNEYTLYLDKDNAAYFENLIDLDVSAPDGVTVVAFNGVEGNIQIRAVNTTDMPQTFQVNDLDGERVYVQTSFKGRRFADKRDQASIRRYGPRRLTYPVQLISLDDDIIDAMNMILAVHSGSQGLRPLQRIDLSLSARRNPEYLGIGVSDVVRCTGFLGLSGQDFFVDEINYTKPAATNDLDILLKCSSVEASRVWIAGQSRLGIDNRVAR